MGSRHVTLVAREPFRASLTAAPIPLLNLNLPRFRLHPNAAIGQRPLLGPVEPSERADCERDGIRKAVDLEIST